MPDDSDDAATTTDAPMKVEVTSIRCSKGDHKIHVEQLHEELWRLTPLEVWRYPRDSTLDFNVSVGSLDQAQVMTAQILDGLASLAELKKLGEETIRRFLRPAVETADV